jgi:hypothetical protein
LDPQKDQQIEDEKKEQKGKRGNHLTSKNNDPIAF